MDAAHKKLRIILLVVLGIVLAGIAIGIVKENMYRCHALASSITYSLPKVDESTNCNEISDRINLFTMQVMQKMESQDNQFVSPFSLYELMSMIYFGATGETKEQIRTALSMPGDDKEIGEGLYSLNNRLDQTGNENFLCANAIWMDKSLTLEENIDPNFLAPIKNYMQSEVYSEDFSKNNTVKKIDHWADKISKGYIPKLGIVPNTGDVMYLLNAVCFEDDWEYPFKKKDTEDKTFHGTKGDSEIKMMTQDPRYYKCMDNEQVMGIQMPYKGNYVMEVYMSKDENQTIQDVCSTMSSEDCLAMLDGLNQQGKEVELKLFYPRLKLDYQFDAKKVYQDLGIADAFNDTKAEFSNIAENQGVSISNAGQKTYLEVDEEGTKAFVISFGSAKATSSPIDNYFIVDRPFLFLIRNTETNTILFYGSIKNL